MSKFKHSKTSRAGMELKRLRKVETALMILMLVVAVALPFIAWGHYQGPTDQAMQTTSVADISADPVEERQVIIHE